MDHDVESYRVQFSDGEISEYLSRAREILDTGALAPSGNNAELERAFAALVGVRHAVAVSSGTAALEIALRCLDLGGRTVLAPANTNYATAEAVLRSGNRLALYDAGLYPELDRIEAAWTSDIAAVIAVHIGGYVTSAMPQIVKFCDQRGIALVEDASHAHGSARRGRHAGTFGAVAAFSTFATKALTTGEGGILVTDNPELAALGRRYRDQGKADDGIHSIVFGSAWRMSELHAALGVVQMPGLPAVLDRANQIIGRYASELVHPLVSVPYDHDARYSGHKLIVMIAEGGRKSLRAHLLAHGIHTARGVYEAPLHRQPALQLSAQPPFTLAEQFASQHLCLPMWKGLTDAQVGRVIDAVNSWPGP